MNPNAAGIDVGAHESYVAVPPERNEQPVRSFGCFTEDLHALADWLIACGITSVALESTGVYWVPIFQILETCGVEVFLVNARHIKAVPGRKTDVLDCQWLQELHSFGLLAASFRPADDICVLRSYWRHRDNLVRDAAAHTQHRQKALEQMNIQLHKVISDSTGVTGLRIIDAILAGQRDRLQLAALKDDRIASSRETIAKSLVGDYRPAPLFTLRQALDAYRSYQRLLAQCDTQIEAMLQTFDSALEPEEVPCPPPTTSHRTPQRNEPHFDLRHELSRILGVDLTQGPGLNTLTVHTLFGELDRDLSRFPTVKHFTSWLGLCPDNRVSGGRVLSAHTRTVNNRAATALRLAAQSLHRRDSALGEYSRRMRAKLGAPKAITATAHNLARLIYHLLTTRTPYEETTFADNEQRYQQRRERRLRKEAAALGFVL
ncbi:MAG: IS110 family transposase, partial [Candidatus Latescibacteria bacterium]|nr:IS110 family transposase [Candidatus Latescibacterota bacterium]